MKLFILNHKHPNYDQTNFIVVLAENSEEAKKLVDDESYRYNCPSSEFQEPEEIAITTPCVVITGE